LIVFGTLGKSDGGVEIVVWIVVEIADGTRCSEKMHAAIARVAHSIRVRLVMRSPIKTKGFSHFSPAHDRVAAHVCPPCRISTPFRKFFGVRHLSLYLSS